MVTDSIILLVEHAPELLGSEMGAWIAHRRPAAPARSVEDLLFHAAKKIATMGELDLIPKPAIERCLAGLGEGLLAQCPEEDRELLRQNLDRLRRLSLAGAAADPVPILDRQPGAEAARAARESQTPAPGRPREAGRGLRRLSLFLERLQVSRAGPVEEGPPVEPRRQGASQFMTAAAVQSSTSKELEDHLAPLRQ